MNQPLFQSLTQTAPLAATAALMENEVLTVQAVVIPAPRSVIDAWWTVVQDVWARAPSPLRGLVSLMAMSVLANVLGADLIAEEIRSALVELLDKE